MVLSDDQMNAMLGKTNLSPDQSKYALAGSNGMITNMINGYTNTLAGGLGQIGIGAGKQIMQTSEDMGGQVLKGTGDVIQSMTGKPLPGGDPTNPGFSTQPTNALQKTGDIAASTGEFFAPGGAEEDIATKGSTYLDKLPDLLGLTGKAADAVKATLGTAFKSAISSASMGGVTAAQGGTTQQIQQNATLGAIGGGISGALETIAPGFSQALNKADFRLSPTQEAKTSKIADDAASFITNNKILGSDTTKFQKLSGVTSKLESTLQNSLPEGLAVPKQDIIDNINENVESLKSSDPAVYSQARNKADEAIDVLASQKGENAFTKGGTINLKDALSGKRSWASMAFKTAQKGKSDPTVSNEGAYAAEQGYQKALQDTLGRTNTTIKIPSGLQSMFGGQSEMSLADFNKVYSQAINAKNLTGMAQFKNDAGLFGRMFGLWVGKSIGQAVSPGLGGEIVGGAIGEIASQKLPGVARNMGERILTQPDFPTQVAKTTAGVTQGSNQ